MAYTLVVQLVIIVDNDADDHDDGDHGSVDCERNLAGASVV